MFCDALPTATSGGKGEQNIFATERSGVMNLKTLLVKYPNLVKLIAGNEDKFLSLLDRHFALMDKQLDTDTASKKIFGMDSLEASHLFVDVFFNPKGILRYYPNKDHASALSTLNDEDIHPLSLFLDSASIYDMKGNYIPKYEFSTAEDVTQFFQSVLFSARFMNQKDLTRAMLIKDPELVDAIRLQKIQELIKIQPALEYQQAQGIQPLKRIKETGFFDCGSTDEKVCPACKVRELEELQELRVCRHCHGGFKNK